KSASLNYENGKLTYEQASRGIELNVRIAFYGLLYEKEQISMQERNVETARQQYEQTRTRYQNGRASELDLLSSQISYESLLPNLQSARLTFDKDLSLFKQTIGINQSEKINLQGSLSDAIILNNFKSDFSTSEMPSVKQAANNVALSKAALLARRLTAYGPTLTAGWSYGKTKSEGSDKWQTGDSISLGVQIPLDGFLPWTRTGQTVSDAKDSVKSAELALENAIISAEVQTNDYINQIKQKQAQLEVLKSNVELAQKSYDMMLNAYNHGTRDFLNLQTALNSLMSARLNLAAQEYSLITAILNLEYSLGIPFGTLGK
ncbi:MAG: TolC family protein, partial [Treponema sp.]|nr:TolC family protein [Treponema sp.]